VVCYHWRCELVKTRADGSVVVRFLYKPLVPLIWIGCLVMASAASFR
jgi:cytochrome c biogenesis factor